MLCELVNLIYYRYPTVLLWGNLYEIKAENIYT